MPAVIGSPASASVVVGAAPGEGVDLERRTEGDAEAGAGHPAEALEHLALVEVLPAEPVDVRTVRLQRLHALVEGLGGVDPVPGLGGAGGPDRADPAPLLEAVGQLLGEDPPVAGVADAVEDRAAHRDVVGLVERSRPEPVAEVA